MPLLCHEIVTSSPKRETDNTSRHNLFDRLNTSRHNLFDRLNTSRDNLFGRLNMSRDMSCDSTRLLRITSSPGGNSTINIYESDNPEGEEHIVSQCQV